MNQELYNTAQAVLIETGEKLRALGLSCTVAPMSLPQGMCLTLLVGDTPDAAVLAEDVINQAARRPS